MLVDRFSRDVQSGGDLAGGLVHIADSPFVVPDAFKETDGPRQDRALAALARLGDTKESRDAWKRIADKSPGVKTTLSKLGTEVAANLIYHAYVLAMVNLHVVLGYPLLDVPARSRFVGMVS